MEDVRADAVSVKDIKFIKSLGSFDSPKEVFSSGRSIQCVLRNYANHCWWNRRAW